MITDRRVVNSLMGSPAWSIGRPVAAFWFLLVRASPHESIVTLPTAGRCGTPHRIASQAAAECSAPSSGWPFEWSVCSSSPRSAIYASAVSQFESEERLRTLPQSSCVPMAAHCCWKSSHYVGVGPCSLLLKLYPVMRG